MDLRQFPTSSLRARLGTNTNASYSLSTGSENRGAEPPRNETIDRTAGWEGRSQAHLGTFTVISSDGLRKTSSYLPDCQVVMNNQSADLPEKGWVCRFPFCKLLSIRLLRIPPPQTPWGGQQRSSKGGRWNHEKRLPVKRQPEDEARHGSV